MRKFNNFWYGVLVSLFLVVTLGYRSGDWALEEYESDVIATSTTEASVTLTEVSPDCTFENQDTSISITLTFNGAANDDFVLTAGSVYNTASSGIPIFLKEFSHDAASGTPNLQYICWFR